jgi:hypothetical protein
VVCEVVMAGSQEQICNPPRGCDDAARDAEAGRMRTMMNDFLSGFLEELGMEICRRSKVRGARRISKVHGAR